MRRSRSRSTSTSNADLAQAVAASIMVGDDPVMLVSDLQKQFPDNVIEIDENYPGLVAKVVELIEYLH